jgi:4a-hydroxytetrahydrobiopterin dehydratase
MKYPRLEPEAVRQALLKLEGWSLREDGAAIVRSFKFASFAEALGLKAESALVAEKLNHHPEWSNVYSRDRV